MEQKKQQGRFRVRNLGDDEDEDESEPKVAIPVDTVLPKKPSRFTVRHVPSKLSPSPLYDRLSGIITQLQLILQDIPRRGGKKSKRRKSLRKKRTLRHRRK